MLIHSKSKRWDDSLESSNASEEESSYSGKIEQKHTDISIIVESTCSDVRSTNNDGFIEATDRYSKRNSLSYFTFELCVPFSMPSRERSDTYSSLCETESDFLASERDHHPNDLIDHKNIDLENVLLKDSAREVTELPVEIKCFCGCIHIIDRKHWWRKVQHTRICKRTWQKKSWVKLK